MKWLVQEILNNGSNIVRIINALEECLVDYLLIRVNNDNTLTVLDKQSKLPLDNSDLILQEFIKDENVMVYGSKTFVSITKGMHLQPGSFMTEQFEFEVFQNALGNELLNNEFIVGELLNLKPIANKFFIRPTGNTKLFSGMMVSREDFLKWQERERELNEESPYMGQSLMISPIQSIEAEYRFFIVNQEIITYSSYKVGELTDTSSKPSDELVAYAERMVKAFKLAEAFVIDIAKTAEGFKVIEYNNINSSGLYGCDEIAFVQAINSLK